MQNLMGFPLNLKEFLKFAGSVGWPPVHRHPLFLLPLERWEMSTYPLFLLLLYVACEKRNNTDQAISRVGKESCQYSRE